MLSRAQLREVLRGLWSPSYLPAPQPLVCSSLVLRKSLASPWNSSSSYVQGFFFGLRQGQWKAVTKPLPHLAEPASWSPSRYPAMRCGGGAGDYSASPSPASQLSVAPWREKRDQNTLPGHTGTEHGYLCKQNRRLADCAWCFIRDDSKVGQGLVEHALKVTHKSQKARIGVDRASGAVHCVPIAPYSALT